MKQFNYNLSTILVIMPAIFQSAAFLMLKLPEILREMVSSPTTDGSSSKTAVFKGLRIFLASTSLVDLADRKAQADTALLFLQVLRVLYRHDVISAFLLR